MSSTFTPSDPAAVASGATDVPEPRAAAPVDAAAEPRGAAKRPRRVPLGEELPIFCEQCGYALHGLPQNRCDHCRILHFACPECGHHQPINTLRPAAQRVIARIRFVAIGLWVLFALNFFGWLLVGAFAMGTEWSYSFHYFTTTTTSSGGTGAPTWTYSAAPRPVDGEAVLAFTLFGLGFGLLGRMFLLRWRRGWAVGLVLATLVLLAIELGAFAVVVGRTAVQPLGRPFHLLTVGTALAVLAGAVVAWPLWKAMAHLFLPPATARAMLDWQRHAPAAEVPV